MHAVLTPASPAPLLPPVPPPPPLQAYGLLEACARHVLSALCRSSLLRLRSDAFHSLLDDLPLSRSCQGSSCLTAKSMVDNFSHLSASEGAALLPLFADPQVGAAPFVDVGAAPVQQGR